MSTDWDLKGKTAIVTGAARNLGRGFAQMLARRGANLIVHYNIDKSRSDAEETARLVRSSGGNAQLVQADFSRVAEVNAVVDQCVSRFGAFDILVNCAGLIIKKPFVEITDQEFELIFAINTRAPFLLMQAAASRMREHGRIINIATSVLACSFPFYSIYAGSKAPLEHFTRALAHELSERHITVNTVAPGALDTPFFYGAETAESVAQIKQFTGGLGTVETSSRW